MLKETSVREAIRQALIEELEHNQDCIMMGENFRFGGNFSSNVLTRQMYLDHGPLRVMETPVQENGIIGLSFGAALAGMTAVPEIYAADFLTCIGQELINCIPKWRYQHQYDRPIKLVVRAPMGLHKTGGGGPEHSQCPESYFWSAPGIVIVAPSTASDALGLLRSALKCGDPVIFLEHRNVYDEIEPLETDDYFDIPIGKARISREGKDVTIVAWSMMQTRAIKAAEKLAKQNIEAEVIDPRTIKPMDFEAIAKSVQKTGKLIVVEEAPATGSISGEIITRVMEHGVHAKCKRLTMPDMPYHYNLDIEKAIIPSVDDIVRAAAAM